METIRTPNITLTHAESTVMWDLLTPLQVMIQEANPGCKVPIEDIFFHITLPLLTHICLNLMEIISAASLWRQIQSLIQLKCITDGQWCQIED